jgi:protein SCO1/2
MSPRGRLRRDAALLALCLLVRPALSQDNGGDGLPGSPAPGPRYLLQGPGGRAVTSDDFRGRFQLVTFGYVGCPDVCPTTLLQMKEILQTLGTQAHRLQPVFITVDPDRDSAEVVRDYTAAFDPRILGLRGSAELTRHAARSFKVHYEVIREPGAPASNYYTVDHTVGMFLLGPQGELLTRFAYGMPTLQVAQRIAMLLKQAAPR